MATPLSRAEIVAKFRKILECRSDRKWQELHDCLEPVLETNEDLQQRDSFIQDLRAEFETGKQHSRLETCLVDVKSQAIAARIIRSESSPEKEPAPKTFEYQEIALAWFTNGRLSAFKTLQDGDARRERQPAAASTPQSLSNLRPTRDPKGRYHNYIASINSKNMQAEFHRYCQPKVTHNTHEKTIPEYIKLISGSQAAIKNLYFDVQDVLADEETGQVAARLEFTGTPVQEWAGAKPNGESVRFHEHVMYWLDEGKITWVWSIVDLDTYRLQLEEY